MKQYPSIQKMTIDNIPNIYLYCFQKIDGSNIRAEWNTKKGFYKFGTKTQLIDNNSKPFGRAIKLIQDKYADDLSLVFKEQKWRNVICFFELYGPSSFAGSHNFEEEMTVTLFDANPYKKGILEPREFIKYFGHLDIPRVIHQGQITSELFHKVKQSTLSDMTFEGCVCKGESRNNAQMPTMFKIKSQAWLNKLKEYCKGNDKLFAMLE